LFYCATLGPAATQDHPGKARELFKSIAEYYFKQHAGDVETWCLSILLGPTVLRIKNIWNIDIEEIHNAWGVIWHYLYRSV